MRPYCAPATGACRDLIGSAAGGFYRLPLAPTWLTTPGPFAPAKGPCASREMGTGVTMGFGEIGSDFDQHLTFVGIAVMDPPNTEFCIRLFFLVAVVVGAFTLGNVPLPMFAQPSGKGNVLPGLSPVEKQQQVVVGSPLCAVFQSPGVSDQRLQPGQRFTV